jgi:hypothetical protein
MADSSSLTPWFPRVAPALFRKVAEPELSKVQPFVRELYGPRPAEAAKALGGQRAAEVASLLHLRVHSIPFRGAALALRLAAVFVTVAVWLMLATPDLQLRCFAAAVLYSFAESAFTYLERANSYTSFSQFVAVILYAPLLLDAYGAALDSSTLAYVALFPLNVWLLELVVGLVLIWVHGHNVAWCYADYADTFALGQARVGHAPAWLALGLACSAGYPICITATQGEQIHESNPRRVADQESGQQLSC